MKLAFILAFLFVVVVPYVSAQSVFARRERFNGNNNGNNGDGNPQTSLTLDRSVIATAYANNGIITPDPEFVVSETSTNNFINFCLGATITNGQQNKDGSCNVTPIGFLPPASSMPSCQFENPKNGDVIPANQNFTVVQIINNFKAGFASNATTTFLAAPQRLNDSQITGHSHVNIQKVELLADPLQFVFFKALNFAAVDGKLNTTVTGGLPPGKYRACSMLTSTNHSPVVLPIAQHGNVDDCVYFSVEDTGKGGNTGNGGDTGNGGSADTSAQDGIQTSNANVNIGRPGNGKGGKHRVKRRFVRETA